MAIFQRSPVVRVDTSNKYPGYGIAWIGDLAVPVMVRDGEVVDCFTRGMGAVSAFTDVDEAWTFIEMDYAAMHRWH